MNLDTYQTKVRQASLYKGKDKHEGLLFTGFSLAAEAGEVASRLSKMMNGEYDALDTREWRFQLSKKLGDALCALSLCAYELGYNLGDVANDNLRKLQGGDNDKRNF